MAGEFDWPKFWKTITKKYDYDDTDAPDPGVLTLAEFLKHAALAHSVELHWDPEQGFPYESANVMEVLSNDEFDDKAAKMSNTVEQRPLTAEDYAWEEHSDVKALVLTATSSIGVKFPKKREDIRHHVDPRPQTRQDGQQAKHEFKIGEFYAVRPQVPNSGLVGGTEERSVVAQLTGLQVQFFLPQEDVIWGLSKETCPKFDGIRVIGLFSSQVMLSRQVRTRLLEPKVPDSVPDSVPGLGKLACRAKLVMSFTGAAKHRLHEG